MQLSETHDGAHDGAGPHEDEEAPAPQPLLAQGDERDGGVGAGDVPVDGGVVPLAEHLFSLPAFG